MGRDRASAILTSILAGALAVVFMYWARAALQVRTLPERIEETALLAVPPDQFEATIEKYGPMAKELALYATTAIMFLALVGIALAAQRWIRRPGGLLLLGLALWLLAMAVIMPLTGAGLFATGLFQNPVLVNLVYLAIGLAYGSVLLAGRLGPAETGLPAAQLPEAGFFAYPARRAFLAGVAGTLAAFAGTLALGKTSTQIASSLPLASAPPAGEGPSPGPGAPQPSPAAELGQLSASAPVSASPAPSPGASAGPPSASPSSSAFVYPSAPPERPLPRDKDGALLAVNKPKGELQPLVTPNADWYTVTKNAGGDPRIEAQDWRLIIDGSVNRPVQVDYPTLVRLPQVTIYKTLECISNLTDKCDLTSFGCDLTSTAKWVGARLPDVLALAGGLKPGVVAIAAFGADEFSSALPASAASDPNVVLAYMMNDSVLPREHGFPVRLLVPDRYGMKSAKWVVNLKPMTQQYVDWYGQRNWSQTGIVKTMSRIDVPANGAKLTPGQAQIGGIAYGGARGIAKVEFSTDGGRTWQPAAVTPGPGQDTFAQRTGTFQIAAGQTLQLVSRATDGTGALQIQTFNLPQPNGGTGWNSIQVSA
jgi:DMSO/TMAO reductase YedYZ molybdopterin-dependent catalytic subunit